MLEILDQICKEKKPAAIYTNCERTDTFNYGIVLAFDDRFAAIQLLSPDGENDGILVTDVENIYRIDMDGQYDRKMAKLCAFDRLTLPSMDLSEKGIVDCVLHMSIEQRGIASVELLHSGIFDIVGFAERAENGQCTVRQIDEYGEEDGTAHIHVSDITEIVYDSQDERRIRRLWERR